MGLREKLKWCIKSVPSVIRLGTKKLIYGKRFNFEILQNIDLNAHIKIEDKGSLAFGRSVQIRDSSEIHVSDNGKIVLADGVFINRGCMIVSKKEITIDKGTALGPYVMVYDHDHDINNFSNGKYRTKPVHIGKNCWIGAGSIILKGVTIGDNAVVAAGSIVTHDIPEKYIYKNKISDSITEIKG